MVEKAMDKTQLNWANLAQTAAKDAHENNFASRRGLYVVEGVGIVYYDNNPFKLPREADRREELIGQLRKTLKNSGIEEGACAYYPTVGESKDYTFAMVINAPPVALKALRVCFSQIVDHFINGWHEGIELGPPSDGDSRQYTVSLSAFKGGSSDHSPSTETTAPSSKKRKATPLRSRQIRDDASIASAVRSIAAATGIPEDSIRLVLPNGRKARADASVASLRAKYD